MKSRWPSRLWIVRHGESAGNVARDLAHASGLGRIDIAERDVDVPLSELGKVQARALGHWFAGRPATERPEVVLTSPYLRAVQTASLVRDAHGLAGDEVPGRGEEFLCLVATHSYTSDNYGSGGSEGDGQPAPF